MSKRFFEHFPPPVFLTMPAVGISLESDAIRVVSFEPKHGFLVLKSANEFNLDAGTIVGGELSKPTVLKKALENIHYEHKTHFARVTLPEEKAYVYEITIPVPEDGNLSDAVEFSIDQNIPLTAAEAVFDYAVVEGPFDKDGVQSVKVVVSAYPRANTDAWVEILKQAGVTPTSMMPESLALARTLVPHGDKRTLLIVHFLKDKTIIAVASGGLVRFATVVTNSLENSAAEKVLASHEGEKIAESVELLAVRDEVKKVHEYWITNQGIKTQKDPRSVQSIVVTGHVADMADVSEYLGKHVGVPAFLGNVWQNAFSVDTFVPDIEFEDSLRYAAAIGVALPDTSPLKK